MAVLLKDFMLGGVTDRIHRLVEKSNNTVSAAVPPLPSAKRRLQSLPFRNFRILICNTELRQHAADFRSRCSFSKHFADLLKVGFVKLGTVALLYTSASEPAEYGRTKRRSTTIAAHNLFYGTNYWKRE
jgi:hypothetical protein